MVQINAISSILLITAASSTFGLPTPSNNQAGKGGLSARSNQPQRLNLRSSTPPLPQGVQSEGQQFKSKRNNKNSKRNSTGTPLAKSFTGRKQTKDRRRLGESSIKALEERGHSHEHIHIHEHDHDHDHGHHHGHNSHHYKNGDLEYEKAHHSKHWAEHHGLSRRDGEPEEVFQARSLRYGSDRSTHRRPHPREFSQENLALNARNSDSEGDLLKIVVAGPDNIRIKAKREPAPHSDHWYDHRDYDRHHHGHDHSHEHIHEHIHSHKREGDVQELAPEARHSDHWYNHHDYDRHHDHDHSHEHIHEHIHSHKRDEQDAALVKRRQWSVRASANGEVVSEDSDHSFEALQKRGLIGGIVKPLLAPLNAIPGFVTITDLLFGEGDGNLIKKVTSLVLHAEPRKDDDNARMAATGMPSSHFTYSLMASKSERTQVYLVPQNDTTSSSSSSNATEASFNQETVKIVVPLLNATSGEPMNWCATFAQKPPSPLELWPCDDNNSTRSQRFAYDSTSGDLSPLYTKSWAGSLARVQAANSAASSMDDVDDSIDSTGSSDEEESPSKRFYRRMAEKSSKKNKDKKLMSIKAKVGSKKLGKVQLRRQADDVDNQDNKNTDPIQAAAAGPSDTASSPASSSSSAPSSTPSTSSPPVSSDAQPPQPLQGETAPASSTPPSSTAPPAPSASATSSSESGSGSTAAKKGSVSLKFVPAGASAQSFAVGKSSSSSSSSSDVNEDDFSSEDLNGGAATGAQSVGSDGESTTETAAPIQEAVQQSIDDQDDSSSSSSEALNGGNSFVSNLDDSSSPGPDSSSDVQPSTPTPMVNQSQVQPADLEAVPTPADE